jgi:HlyD family secretion protein
MNKLYYFFSIGLFFIASCSNTGDEPDAYGNFEVIETIISSESTGKILKSFIEEGDEINPGDTAFLIDNTSIQLQKQTLLNQKNALSSGFSNIIAQSDVLKKQKEVLEREKNRIQRQCFHSKTIG